jgi:hypothetical protein
MNFISGYVLECQHPIGPHVHVIMPEDDEITLALFHMFGVNLSLKEELDKLSKLTEKGQAASKVSIFPAQCPPAPGCEVWVVCNIIIKPDTMTELRAVFLKIDQEFGVPGIKVAEMFGKGIRE